MTVKIVDIDTLKLNPENPRKITGADLEALANTLLNQGWLKNLVVSGSQKRKNIVLDGNQRLKAARLLIEKGYDEYKKVPIVYVEKATLKEEGEIAFTMNLPRGRWDWSKIKEMDFTIEELGEVGFEKKELLEKLPTDYHEPEKKPIIKEEIRYFKKIYILLELNSVSQFDSIKEELLSIKEKGVSYETTAN